MPRKRMAPPSDAASEGAEPPLKAQRIKKDSEKAFIAASRRADRSLSDRIGSALLASECHRERTGRRLKVTEEAVRGDVPYESEEDEEPGNGRLGSVPRNQTLSSQYSLAAQRYDVVSQDFREAFSGLPPLDQLTALRRQQLNRPFLNLQGTTATLDRANSLPSLSPVAPALPRYPAQDAGDLAQAPDASMSSHRLQHLRSYSLPQLVHPAQDPSANLSLALYQPSTGLAAYHPLPLPSPSPAGAIPSFPGPGTIPSFPGAGTLPSVPGPGALPSSPAPAPSRPPPLASSMPAGAEPEPSPSADPVTAIGLASSGTDPDMSPSDDSWMAIWSASPGTEPDVSPFDTQVPTGTDIAATEPIESMFDSAMFDLAMPAGMDARGEEPPPDPKWNEFLIWDDGAVARVARDGSQT
ncbi:uncharacterized protein B0T15DRAFT_575034 [Chaetomium strumarium]|uniref:Uncharacterized protein n=1 Tax=Chaetomium strumarium TaxID=1170767 RepID=A0AAJ0GTP4_9PEZI|nr:hypothetical protein B0T15DRAFT_575034 [Chaetomium strumarium]